jgi:hypothetical protein
MTTIETIDEFDLPIMLDYDDLFPNFIKELIKRNQDRNQHSNYL